MRTALSCFFFAVLTSSWAAAQQDPPRPPGSTPPVPATEAKPPEGKSPDPKPKPADANAPIGVDPARMAPPKAGDASKPGGPMDERSYILGAEDQIGIVVNGSADFNGTHLIRPDGRITVNLVGEVAAAGLTPEELTDALKEKIKKFVVDPDVTISVLQVNSKRYFIQGEVNHPGEFKLVVPTKILEALVNAGGFRDFAKTKDIVIIREEGSATKRMHFNYKDVIKGKHLDQNIFLKAGDILVVR
jgi:polysaccharide export outer membrane protein